MSAPEWVIIVALGWLALWIVAGVLDELAESGEARRVEQPVRADIPLPPTRQTVQPTWGRVDYVPPGPGRHRMPVKGEQSS